jgi:hypothetical protein
MNFVQLRQIFKIRHSVRNSSPHSCQKISGFILEVFCFQLHRALTFFIICRKETPPCLDPKFACYSGLYRNGKRYLVQTMLHGATPITYPLRS